MKKISVIHLVESLEAGGIERVVATIAQQIDKEKYTFSVWTLSMGGSIADELINDGIEVRSLDIDTFHDYKNFFKLAKLLKKHYCDILHTHTYFTNTIGRVSAKMAKIPVIITHVHSTYQHYSFLNILIEKVLSFFSDKIICCSNAVRNFVIRKEKINKNKVVTIYNGINANNKRNPGDTFRMYYNINKSDIIITSIGSLNAHKGHRYLLEALSIVKEQYPNIKCLIAGQGPLKQELEDICKTLEISSIVSFIGLQRDVSLILKNSDIYIQPSSEREGLGNAVIEAMAYGVPVIASAIGGLPEVVVDKITGYLVPPKNPQSIAEKIQYLISHKDTMRQCGLEAWRVYQDKFTAYQMMNQIDKIYTELYDTKVR